jgi:hypothetical protein
MQFQGLCACTERKSRHATPVTHWPSADSLTINPAAAFALEVGHLLENTKPAEPPWRDEVPQIGRLRHSCGNCRSSLPETPEPNRIAGTDPLSL